MEADRALTDSLRRRLQKPLGFLLKGSPQENVKQLAEIVSEKKPAKTIVVGDFVSKNILKSGLKADIFILDGKIMRENIEPIEIEVPAVFETNNPQGTITSQSHQIMRLALKVEGPSKIVVRGEEDLLALLAILYSPEGSLIIYGQPREGLVVVEATHRKKKEIGRIVENMKIVQS